MSVKLIGTTSGIEADVQATSKALRVLLYDANGNVLSVADRSAITPGSQGGILQSGADYKTARLVRITPSGTLCTTNDSLLLYDTLEGAAYDSNKWVQSLTTHTITQGSGILTFNAGSSVATTTGSLMTSNRAFPYITRNGLVFRTRARATAHFANGQIQFGFGDPTAATAVAMTNGACWRKDATGQWLPVITIAGAETLGTPISNATFIASIPTTDYALWEIFLEETRATFTIQSSLGVIVTTQVLDFTAVSPTLSATHVRAFHQVANTAATGTAVQLLVAGTTVVASDVAGQRDWATAMSGMNYNSVTSPTLYTQLANHANNSAPTARTLSNTAAAETTLGGRVKANSIAGSLTNDLILFGFQVPSPYTFYMTGIRISPPLNQVVAVATSATIFTYAVAFNSSAVSLATAGPYTPMVVPLGGVHSAAIATAANAIFSGNDIVWNPGTPLAVQPGKFLHVTCRELVGTATGTETYEWAVSIDGYFE